MGGDLQLMFGSVYLSARVFNKLFRSGPLVFCFGCQYFESGQIWCRDPDVGSSNPVLRFWWRKSEARGGQTGRRDPVIQLSVQGPDKKLRHIPVKSNCADLYLLSKFTQLNY